MAQTGIDADIDETFQKSGSKRRKGFAPILEDPFAEISSIVEYTDEDLKNDMYVLGKITPVSESNQRILSFEDFCRLYVLIKKHIEPR